MATSNPTDNNVQPAPSAPPLQDETVNKNPEEQRPATTATVHLSENNTAASNLATASNQNVTTELYPQCPAPPTYQEALAMGAKAPSDGPSGAAAPNYGYQMPVVSGLPVRQFQNQSPNIVIQTVTFGSDPIRMMCPQCNTYIETRVENRPTVKTHILALVLCLMTLYYIAPCVYCCCCLGAKNHYCPNCKALLGKYEI